LWLLPKKLQVAAAATLKGIALGTKHLVSCAQCAMPVPLESVAATQGANDAMAGNLELMWAQRLFESDFSRSFDGRERIAHSVLFKLPNAESSHAGPTMFE
jgi:hypothetical protein